MSDRAKEFMSRIWDARNNGADTETKLVASILSLSSEYVKNYTAQNDLILLDKVDLLDLSKEVESIT